MTDQVDTYKIAISQYILNRKIPAGDPAWGKFNAGFENYSLGISRIVSAIYEGRAITTQHKDHWRTAANYLCGQHLGLDFDNGDQTSSIDHLIKDDFVGRYGAFLYSTISHTDESPRSRVIFLLDKPIMQAKNYALAASAFLWLFGTADRQCKDAVRFFYGAPGCRVEMINNILPLETVQHLIAQYVETGKNEKHKSQGAYYPPTNQQEVADALKFIPPWQVDYGEWVEILMAIHSAFGEGGYGLAESWGDGKGNEIEKKWASFKAAGNTAGAITIATVFGIAKRFGWKRSSL